MKYNIYDPKAQFPKNEEAIYFHLRYNVIDEEQDAQQIDLIKNHPLVEKYVISEIEHEGTEKPNHRHVTIELYRKRMSHIIRPELIKYKYASNQIYFKPKMIKSTIDELLTYTLKSGCYDSNWTGEKIDKILNPDRHHELVTQEKIKENKKKVQEFREKFEQLRNGNFDWFFDNHPRYILTAEFQRAIVWSQKDILEALLNSLNLIICDESRTGKSAGVRFITDPNDLYTKNKSRDTWDGYNNVLHKYVLLDEFDSIEALESISGLEGFKLLLDYYPFDAKFMYANRNLKIRPQRVFVCTNSDIFALLSKDKYGKERNDFNKTKIALLNRCLYLNTTNFHQMFGIRLDKSIKRIVFDFKGMSEKKYQPYYELFDDYLINKFQTHLDYWTQHGEKEYIKWQRKEQKVDDSLKDKLDKRQKLIEKNADFFMNTTRVKVTELCRGIERDDEGLAYDPDDDEYKLVNLKFS